MSTSSTINPPLTNPCSTCGICHCCNLKRSDSNAACYRCGNCFECNTPLIDAAVQSFVPDLCTQCRTFSVRYLNALFGESRPGYVPTPLCTPCSLIDPTVRTGICRACKGEPTSEIDARGPSLGRGPPIAGGPVVPDAANICLDCGGVMIGGQCAHSVSAVRPQRRNQAKLPRSVGKNPNRR
jgi:hypothetical protein